MMTLGSFSHGLSRPSKSEVIFETPKAAGYYNSVPVLSRLQPQTKVATRSLPLPVLTSLTSMRRSNPIMLARSMKKEIAEH